MNETYLYWNLFIFVQDICCTSTGRILATDSNNQCVQVFTLQGEPRARFGERGRTVGQLQRPTGVAEFPSTNQYVVADYENRWVSIFEPNGKFASRFGMGKLLGQSRDVSSCSTT
jgi:tripartite motif-containing protein 2/3